MLITIEKILTYRKKSSSSSESSSKRFLCQENEKDLSFLMQRNYKMSGKRKETSSRLLIFLNKLPPGQLEYLGLSADLPGKMHSVSESCSRVLSLAWQSLPSLHALYWQPSTGEFNGYPRRSKGGDIRAEQRLS